jgi:hypothetical protein
MTVVMEEITRQYELVRDLPPLPYRIMASNDVPRGKTYRQWDTSGRLLVWVNRHFIDTLPRKVTSQPQVLKSAYCSVSIPVEFV